MKLSKAVDLLSPSVLDEIFALSDNEAALDKIVSHSEHAIAFAAKERDENPSYQAAKQACKDLSEGLKEVKAYQKAKAAVALSILNPESRSEEDTEVLNSARSRKTS